MIAKTQLLIALLKREILEHKSIWRVPACLLGLSILVKFSLAFGNLSVNIDIPEQLNLEPAINSVLDAVVVRTLNMMNYIIVVVMYLVSIFYALSCLFNERQDQSVLFWRSLPITDQMTIAAKLLVAVVVIPMIIVLSQAVMAVIFFDLDAPRYLSSYYANSLIGLVKMLLWSLLPVVAWCVFCSQVANKNPFLLAVIAPISLILIDKLFFNGVVSQVFVINRLTGVSDYNTTTLMTGIVFSVLCIGLAIMRRSQRW